MAVWNPDIYLKFAGVRFRPAMDLMQQIPLTDPARIYDLGCGTGHLTDILHQRWPSAKVAGVDSSQEMLARARADFPALEWIEADIAQWRADEPADLNFSNAALQWVQRHSEIVPALLRQVRPGGWLAIQVPRHIDDPGHLLILDTVREARWNAKLAPLVSQLVVHAPDDYWTWLRPIAAHLDIWETIYRHELDGENPVVEFFRGTQLRPYLQALTPSEQTDFLASYGEKVARAYPRQPNGKTLFPFRRLFVLAQAK